MATQARAPLMAGNWKMNLNHQEAVVLVQKLAWTLADKKHDYGKVEVVVVPPFTDLRSVQTLVDGDRLSMQYGAQDVSTHDSGAYTGEISAGMLAKLGCTYVVVGHSRAPRVPRRDRRGRQRQGAQGARRRDDPDRVRRRGPRGPPGRRARAAHAGAGRRLAGRASPPSRSPAWSSPTSRCGRSAPARSPPRTTRRRSARRSGRRIREVHGDAAADGVRVLYGGSVKAANVGGIMAKADVDGCLVGGASLQVDEFGGICRFYDMPVL